MNLDICRKCPYWTEYFTLDERNRMALLYIGCCLEKFYDDDVYKINESKYELVRDAMNGNDLCGFNSREFKNVVDFAKDEHDRLKKLISNMAVPDECDYFVEQKMEDWNR